MTRAIGDKGKGWAWADAREVLRNPVRIQVEAERGAGVKMLGTNQGTDTREDLVKPVRTQVEVDWKARVEPNLWQVGRLLSRPLLHPLPTPKKIAWTQGPSDGVKS